MSKYKELIRNKKFMSGVYAVSLITALLVLALVIKGPETSGKLIADKDGSITGIERGSLGRSEKYDLLLEIDENSGTIKKDVSLNLQISDRGDKKETASAEDERLSDIETEVGSMISTIEYSKEKRIRLPRALSDGTAVRWYRGTSHPGPMIMAVPLVYMALIVFMAVGTVKDDKTAEEERRSILKGLPRFCNQLFLMLNAGLILSDAFDKITESYGRNGSEGMSGFEKDLVEIREASDSHRVSTAQVINEYAMKHDVKEMIRIAAILTENEKRGSDVIESLARESRYLWDERKIVAKEYGKSIDTKMAYPLGLLLILLIVITMAPALLNM